MMQRLIGYEPRMKSLPLFNFNQAASVYDEWFSTPMGRYYDLVEKRAIKQALKNVSGKKLLEIGCGTGHWSKYFSALGFSVLGVDISFKMLRKTFHKRIPWAEFVQSNAHYLPLHDNEFDVAVFITSIEFINEPHNAIKEVVRCIKKPGGNLLIGTLNAKSRLNRNRFTKNKLPYHKASLLSIESLSDLLEPYGKPTIYTCAFSLNPSCPIPIIDPVFDSLAKKLGLRCGDIIIAEVQL